MYFLKKGFLFLLVAINVTMFVSCKEKGQQQNPPMGQMPPDGFDRGMMPPDEQFGRGRGGDFDGNFGGRGGGKGMMGGFGEGVKIEDTTTVKNIVTSFDSASPATIAPPSGNSYVANTSSRDITTLDNNYKSDIAKIKIKITINLSNESTWDSAYVVRSGELITVTTNDSVEIEITGTTTKKSAFLFKNKKEKAIKLTLNNANFSSEYYPCIEFDKKTKVYFETSGVNTLTDGRDFGTGYTSTSKKKGSIYIKGQAILFGNGTLTLNENYKHGIYATDYVRVFEGTWNINSTGRNGIQSVNGFIMDDGEINIKGTGEHTNNESRGIVVEGLDFEEGESNEFPGEGFIVIKGGKITINTVSKGITAKWDIDDDAGSADRSDDPYPYVLISGGTIDITTTGTPIEEARTASTFTDADGETVSENIKCSPEGIEGKQAVIITGGKISLNVTDDGINASRDDRSCSGWVTISGGNIFINSTRNDCIDSNGNMYISGGVIVAYGTAMPESAFDCDQNTFSITGGLAVGFGTTNTSYPTSSATTQGTFALSGEDFGSGTMAITDSKNNILFAFTVPEAIASSPELVMILSSPKIGAGNYTIKTNVTATGGETFHNLYTTLPKISGGTKGTTLKTSKDNYFASTVSTQGWGRGGMKNGGRFNAPQDMNFGR